MAQQVFGPAAVVSVLNRAFTNTSPSNSVFANQVATAGTTDASQLAFAKAFGAQYAVGKTAADLSALLMTNMGLNNALLAAALTDYIAANGTQNVGIIAWQLSSILSNLENDATYGAAAKAWNTEVTDAYQYSSDAANTTPSSGGTTGNEASKSFVLTIAVGLMVIAISRLVVSARRGSGLPGSAIPSPASPRPTISCVRASSCSPTSS